MDAIQGLLSNSFFKAFYDPAVSALKDQYNQHLKAKVDEILPVVFGPMQKRYDEISTQGGVKAETIGSMKDLIDGIKTRLSDPASLSLDRLALDWFNVQTKFNSLNEQAKQEAQAYQDSQATEAAVKVTQAEEDKTFNMYRLLARIKETATKYMIALIVLAVALLGGSLMANRAVNKSVLFRLYYLVYGTILFPISFFVIIQDFIVDGRLPRMYAILAPIFESKNHMATTNTLLFPFVYTKPITLA